MGRQSNSSFYDWFDVNVRMNPIWGLKTDKWGVHVDTSIFVVDEFNTGFASKDITDDTDRTMVYKIVGTKLYATFRNITNEFDLPEQVILVKINPFSVFKDNKKFACDHFFKSEAENLIKKWLEHCRNSGLNV